MKKLSLDEYRGEVLGLLADLRDTARDELAGAGHELIDTVATLVTDQRFNVVVCGEFKRGKSSLLNALAGQRELFPTGQAITTNTVTKLSWGEHERVTVTLRDGDNAVTQEISRADIGRYASETGRTDTDPVADQVDIEMPMETLKTGLVLVDTPGIGSVNKAHTATAFACLKLADAVIVVLAATQKPSRYELDFIREATGNVKAVIVALTMIEKFVDREPVRRDFRKAIDGAVGQRDWALVTTSALLAWTARDRGDEKMLVRSGIPELEDALWNRLAATCGSARLRQALDGFDQIVSLATSPLRTELIVLTQDEGLAEMRAELAGVGGRLAMLRHAGTWHRGMAEDFRTAAADSSAVYQHAVDAAIRRIHTTVDALRAKVGLDELQDMAKAAMIDAASESAQAFAASVVRISETWTERTTVGLHGAAISSRASGDDVLPKPVINRHQVRLRDGKFRDAVKMGAMLAGPMATIGLAAGSVVPGIGTAVGSAVGGALGHILGMVGSFTASLRRARAIAQARDAVKYADLLAAALRKSNEETGEWLRGQREKLESDLRIQLETQISAQAESLEKSRARLEASVLATAEERTAKQMELEARLDRYEALARKAAVLRGSLDE